MVPRSSDRISRVPPYLIRPSKLRVRGCHPYRPAFQLVPLTHQARLVRVRSPLLTEYRLISFPTGTEMFQFPAFALLTLYIQVKSTCFIRLSTGSRQTITKCQVGFPIRTSRDQRVLSPPPGLTQSATSFIASCCQGIHQTPFSRLIRSGRRRALLCEAGSKASTRLVPSVGSLWTRTPSLGKGMAPVAIDERSRRTRHQITVSIRLGKTVFVADVPKDKRQADPPLGKGPKTSRVLLS